MSASPRPRRLWIVGTSGSGKSRLAEQVARVTGFARLELDAVFWDAGWRKRDVDEAKELVRRFVAQHPDGWVIDGNWTSTLDGMLDPPPRASVDVAAPGARGEHPRLGVAHTLVKDAAVLNGYKIPTSRLARITQSVLVATEGPTAEPQFAGLPTDFFGRAANAMTAAIPQTERHTLDGQGHVVAPELMAPLLKKFFSQ